MSTATHPARYALLKVDLPGVGEIQAGVVLHDPASDRIHIRLRRDWAQVAPEEAEILTALEEDLYAKAAEMGGEKLLAHLEDTLSNTIRISGCENVIVENFERALRRLYRRHVHASVQEFVTHLPRYSLAAAAGPFLENPEVEAEGWEEAPPGLRLSREMFIARVAGKSMEPLIHDGDLCIFRRGISGSRNGKLVLVEAPAAGGNERYTVKRYRSEKRQDPDGDWTHERIRLEPLNPAFQAWDLDPGEDRYRVVAEFVQTLD
jgi:SOS-response transcriptional repressor LexA